MFPVRRHGVFVSHNDLQTSFKVISNVTVRQITYDFLSSVLYSN